MFTLLNQIKYCYRLLSGKNIFKIEILSLPVPVRTVHPSGRSGGASFYFAQNDNELSMRQTLRKPCHSEGSPNFIEHNG